MSRGYGAPVYASPSFRFSPEVFPEETRELACKNYAFAADQYSASSSLAAPSDTREYLIVGNNTMKGAARLPSRRLLSGFLEGFSVGADGDGSVWSNIVWRN